MDRYNQCLVQLTPSQGPKGMSHFPFLIFTVHRKSRSSMLVNTDMERVVSHPGTKREQH